MVWSFRGILSNLLVWSSVVVVLVGWSGCASTGTVAVGSTSVSFDAATDRADRAQDDLRSLTGDGTLSVETSSFSQSGDFTLALRKPDSIQITVEGPFGIRVAQALITRTTFQAYSALENKLYVGPTTAENLRKALRLELGFDDILALFTGGRVLDADRRSPDAAGSEGGDAFFVFRDGEVSRRYVVDAASLAIRKLQLLDRNGIMTFEQTFSDFTTIDGVNVPRVIRAIQHQRKQIVTMRYADLRPNAEGFRFEFSPPQNARHVEWK